ncbi:MAG: ABC transporter permease [Anaerolineae bacterium]|nr:ABC transporter permease [Anaerolineae bacterium]
MTTTDSPTSSLAGPARKPFSSALRFFQLFESLGVLLLLVIVVVLVSAVTPNFLKPNNLSSLAITAAIIAVPGMGMTLAIAMGGLDLSIGSLQALTACIAAGLLAVTGIPLTIGGTLLVGALVGLVNGLLITRLRVPAFVATLGMMNVLRGAALLVTNGQSVLLMDEPEFAQLNSAQVLGIPVPVLIALGVFAVFYVLLRHTPFGRHICAIGGNEKAARATGLKVDRVKIAVFVLVGITAALSGVMLTAQLMIVDGTLGVGLELRAITVAVLGGTSMAGGSGNLLGTLLGAVLLSAINSALNILKVPPFYQYMALGLLLILALTLDTVRRIIIRRAVTGGAL